MTFDSPLNLELLLKVLLLPVVATAVASSPRCARCWATKRRAACDFGSDRCPLARVAIPSGKTIDNAAQGRARG